MGNGNSNNSNSSSNSKEKIQDIIDFTDVLYEIALRCDCCAPQVEQIVQDYNNKRGNGIRLGGSSLDLRDQVARRDGSVGSDVFTHSSR